MRTYKLYLIRHGLTQANLDGRYIGTTDLDLCEEGAVSLLSLQKEYEYPGVGRVYSSPLKRCLETARLLYPEITPIAVEELREYHFGEFENKTAEELLDNASYREWLENAQDVVPEGAEEMGQFRERVVQGFDRVIRDMMRARVTEAAVITHAGVISWFLSKCGLPKRPDHGWQVDAGKGYTVLVNASLWGNNQLAEVFTPLPYGCDQESVMLDYQHPLPEELLDFEDEELA